MVATADAVERRVCSGAKRLLPDVAHRLECKALFAVSGIEPTSFALARWSAVTPSAKCGLYTHHCQIAHTRLDSRVEQSTGYVYTPTRCNHTHNSFFSRTSLMGDLNEEQGSAATAATERARALLRARAQTAVATTVARPIEPPAGTTTLIKSKFSPRAVTGAPALPARIQAWANLHAAPLCTWLWQIASRCTRVLFVVHREGAHASYT